MTNFDNRVSRKFVYIRYRPIFYQIKYFDMVKIILLIIITDISFITKIPLCRKCIRRAVEDT